MRSTGTILIAPNEDGFGTSAWTVRLAKALCRETRTKLPVTVLVATEKRERFHQDKYESLPVELRRLSGVTARIELVRSPAGSVDVPQSIRQAVLPYSESRAQYERAMREGELLQEALLVVDWGVPQVVRAVALENAERAVAPQNASGVGRRSGRIPSVTVFDHAWGLSLDKIIGGDATLCGSARRATGAIITEIQNDEALTDEVFLLPDPIAPLDYHGYWRRILGHRPRLIEGVLGGPLAALEYARDSRLDEAVKSWQANGGRCPAEVEYWAHSEARRLLGFRNDDPTLFVSGGGTAVWDDVLGRLIDSFRDSPPNYNVVVYSPSEAGRRDIKFRYVDQLELGRAPGSDRVVFIDRVHGDTHHVLFPAFDLVLTRAGGGTVNDAIACAVPLVLVEEPGMWQVEQIRQSCLRMGIAEGVSLSEFQRRPRACVESGGKLKALPRCQDRMRGVRHHGEMWLARELLAMFWNTASHGCTGLTAE